MTERQLAEQMEKRLESDFVAMTTTAPRRVEPPLTVEELVRLSESFKATQRWLHGPPVRAMKVGRVQVEALRRFLEQQTAGPWDALRAGLNGQVSIFGIPRYEVDAVSHYEVIYEDDAPTTEALNERLMREPRAIWGKVEAG